MCLNMSLACNNNSIPVYYYLLLSHLLPQHSFIYVFWLPNCVLCFIICITFSLVSASFLALCLCCHVQLLVLALCMLSTNQMKTMMNVAIREGFLGQRTKTDTYIQLII